MDFYEALTIGVPKVVDKGYELVHQFKTFTVYERDEDDVYVCNQDGNVMVKGNHWLHKEPLEKIFFTEEELISPCPTIDEYRRRERYLKYYYIKQIQSEYCPPDWDLNVIFDPVSDVFVRAEHKKFVEHHIWLYVKLKQSLAPTIFPLVVDYLWDEEAKTMFMYLDLIPLAEKNDPVLPEAMKFVQERADEMALEYYENGNKPVPIRLVNEGVVSEETLDKLLEMANENSDSEMAAVILNQRKSTARSTFDL